MSFYTDSTMLARIITVNSGTSPFTLSTCDRILSSSTISALGSDIELCFYM
jgi:hypothetical protein